MGPNTGPSLLLLLAGAPAIAQAVAPACDLTKSGDEVCADFCNYKCSFYNESLGETGQPMNMTVYRITPFNTSGIRNKNTGDASGDVGFFLSRKNITQQCAKDPHSFGCFLDGDNMYGEFVVEVDGQWGPYEECNPVNVGGSGGWEGGGWSDTRDFQCGENCLNPTRKANCTGNSGFGKKSNSTGIGGHSYGNSGPTCYCDGTGRQHQVVGRTPKGGTQNMGGSAPAYWPPQCSSGFEPPCLKSAGRYGCQTYGGCVTGTVSKTLHGWDFGSTAAMACDACTDDKACSGWAFAGPDNKTATLFTGEVSVEKTSQCISASREHSRYGGGGGRNWYGVNAGPGFWFSTPLEGECLPGQPVGSQTAAGVPCTWRVVETKKYANASCIDGQVDIAVEAAGKVCFDRCPQPLDKVSDCYLVCYLNTLVGDPAYNLTKLAPELFVGPWVQGFTEDDPAKGGCPRVQPLPCDNTWGQCPPDAPTLPSTK